MILRQKCGKAEKGEIIVSKISRVKDLFLNGEARKSNLERHEYGYKLKFW